MWIHDQFGSNLVTSWYPNDDSCWDWNRIALFQFPPDRRGAIVAMRIPNRILWIKRTFDIRFFVCHFHGSNIFSMEIRPNYLHEVLRIEFVHPQLGTIVWLTQHTDANCGWWQLYHDFHDAIQCLHGREVWNSSPNQLLDNHHNVNYQSVKKQQYFILFKVEYFKAIESINLKRLLPWHFSFLDPMLDLTESHHVHVQYSVIVWV